MPLLLDKIVNDANLSVDFKMENADMPSTTNQTQMVTKVKGFGEQRISMNTEALVKKTSAFALLSQVSENMGKSFAPYVEPLLPIISTHMVYEHSKAIKKAAHASFKNMLVAVGEPHNIALF